MEKGKIIVIEGTDCSGKETQSKKLIEKLNNEGIKCIYFSFPNYSSPTGKIVGLPYLGKPYLAEELITQYIDEVKGTLKANQELTYNEQIVDEAFKILIEKLSHGWFKEGASHVNPDVSSLYYAADRLYNLDYINETLNEGISIILDRYVYSNMAHQGGKLSSSEERNEKYEWLYDLEFTKLGLPESDIKVFLHMPTDYANILKQFRNEALDENELDAEHLRNAERAYLEVAKKYNFETIDCAKQTEDPKFEDIRTPDDISKELTTKVLSLIKK